jgi:hypothetical protein
MAQNNYKLQTNVNVPSWVCDHYGNKAVEGLILAIIVADTDCPAGVGAAWTVTKVRPGTYLAEASVVMEEGFILRSVIDPRSSLLEDVEGFGYALDDIIRRIHSGKDTVLVESNGSWTEVPWHDTKLSA